MFRRPVLLCFMYRALSYLAISLDGNDVADTHGRMAVIGGMFIVEAVKELFGGIAFQIGGQQRSGVLPHTVGGLHHGLVILDFEGVVLERMQFRQRDFPYLLQLGILAAFFGGKQVIVWSQFYFFRAAFQVLSPPWSDSCSPRPPCH